MGYVLSPAAQADIDSIWDYTNKQWGEAQAVNYIQSIKATLEALANGRLRHRSAEHIRPGYRKAPVGSHYIFFRLYDAGTIDVVRILHRRMDPGSRLPDG